MRLLLLSVALTLGPPALAQSPPPAGLDVAEESDLHFRVGVELYTQGAYATALEHLLLSNRLVPNRSVTFNIARTYEKLGQYAQAYRHYADYVALEADPERQQRALDAIEQLRDKVALARVMTDPPGATIFVDRRDLGARGGTPRTLALEPGAHRILLERPGHEPAETEIVVSIGEEVPVRVRLPLILGAVLVEGEPRGAEIRVDDPTGPVVANVPAELPLAPGAHVLYLSAPGHEPDQQLLNVNPRETARALVALDLQTGALVVDATERDALIEIDGEAKGFTPAVLEGLPAGPHRLRVTAGGYRPYEAEVLVEPGGRASVAAALRPLQEVSAASRSAESVMDAPASVSLVGREEIRAFGYQTVYDALAGSRGVFQTDDLTYQYLGFRGFARGGDYGNRVLVTIDGHTVNDDQLGGSYVGTDLLPDLRDMQQIEIVRGPGSALYGSNAFFGVVNLVTVGPDEAVPAHVSVGADTGRLARARVGGGTTWGRDAGLWLSAGGVRAQGADYLFPELPAQGLGNGVSSGADGQSSAAVAGKAWFGDVTVQVSVNGRTKEIPTGAWGTVVGEGGGRTADSRGFAELRWAPTVSKRVRMSNRVYADGYRYDGVFPYVETGGDTRGVERWTGAWCGLEPRVEIDATDWLSVTGGAEARVHWLAELQGYEVSAGAEPDVYLDEDPRFQVWSAYAVTEARAGRWLIASLGGRFDLYTRAKSDALSSVNPRLAVIVRPTPDDAVKVLVGRAYRAPSPYELYYDDGGYTQVKPQSLEPETVGSAEIEVTHRFSDVTTVAASVFGNEIQGLVDLFEVPGEAELFRYGNNEDVTRAVGAEVEARRDWRQGWMLAATASYQHARVGDLVSGDELTNAPAALGSVKAAAPLVPGLATLATRVRAEAPRLTEAGARTEAPLLWDVTLSGALPSGRLEYALGVRNLLDWRYTHPGSLELYQDALPQPARSLFVQTTVRL